MESTANRDDITTQLQSMLQAVEAISARIGELSDVMGMQKLSFEQQRAVIESLPLLTESQIKELDQLDGSCPICLTSYLAILSEAEMAEAMDSPAHPVEELGVTRLSQSWQCGHLFCRRDITHWINSGNDSCPLCRRVLIDPSSYPIPPPPADSSLAPDSPNPNTDPDQARNSANDSTGLGDRAQRIRNLLRQFQNNNGGGPVLGETELMTMLGITLDQRRDREEHHHDDDDDDEDMDRGYSAMYS